MQKEKKYLGEPSAGGNFDDGDFIVKINEWINMENCRKLSTDAGETGTIESIGSTSQIPFSYPAGNNEFLLGCDDEPGNRLAFFLWNDGGEHGIYCYDLTLKSIFTVLLNSQVTGGLGFDQFHLMHSCRVVNGILYWTDSLNNPGSILLDAGIKMNNPGYVTTAVAYVAPLDFTEITLIKKPPALTASIAKIFDSAFNNNFIFDNSFEFAWLYVHYTNEMTVLGPFSRASKLNHVTDNFNAISVTMNPNEVIPQYVRMVKLYARVDDSTGNGTSAYNIRTWDKLVSADLAAIIGQNAATAQLSFNFYGNITGEFIDQATLLKPFDSVPDLAGTLEAAKSRIFLGDTTSGKDAPILTSLTAALTTITISGPTISRILWHVGLSWAQLLVPLNQHGYSAWYFYLASSDITPAGWYEITSTVQFNTSITPPVLPAPPTTEALSGIVFRGATQPDVVAAIKNPIWNVNVQFANVFLSTSNMCIITGLSVTTYDIFKSRSPYGLAIEFLDFALRKCGAVPMPANPISIPSRDFAMTSGVNHIIWALDNTNALAEIPPYAYYYSVIRTLNLRTRFFIEALSIRTVPVVPATVPVTYVWNTAYATKDDNGNYVFTDHVFGPKIVGIGLDTTALVQAGLGYVFAQGDVAFVIRSDDGINASLPVIGQQGKYIIVKAMDIGDTLNFDYLYEVYTPYQTSAEEPYFEVGNMYRVLNPGSVSRVYETLSDVMQPDAFVLTRNFNASTYFAETMSPNDLLYNRWDTDAGKSNLVTSLGRQVNPQQGSFSDTFVPGTAINGLSTFDALNIFSVPESNGAIEKLILASKVEEEGTVMLAICQDETSSIYLGETKLTDATGATQFLGTATGVVSTINELKGSFGTLNPESVYSFKGNVFWFDAKNGVTPQYSENGLFPISQYKMTRFWKQFSKQYLSMTQAQISALGSRPFVFITVDEANWEVLITIPKLLATPPKGYLPDYPSMIYPFDIWDGQAKTVVYRLNANPNYWQGSYTFSPQGFITIQNRLFAFSVGQLWQLNRTDDYCLFFGVRYKSRIMVVFNQFPNKPKVYNNSAVEANMKPTLTYMRTEPSLSTFDQYDLWEQASDLMDFDYNVKEGQLYSPVYRNKLVPTQEGLATDGLLTAEKMRALVLKVLYEFSVTNIPLELRYLQFGFDISRGQET